MTFACSQLCVFFLFYLFEFFFFFFETIVDSRATVVADEFVMAIRWRWKSRLLECIIDFFFFINSPSCYCYYYHYYFSIWRGFWVLKMLLISREEIERDGQKHLTGQHSCRSPPPPKRIPQKQKRKCSSFLMLADCPTRSAASSRSPFACVMQRRTSGGEGLSSSSLKKLKSFLFFWSMLLHRETCCVSLNKRRQISLTL